MNTEEDHPDFSDLQEATILISDVATYVNNKIKEQYSIFKLIELQKTLLGFDEPLIQAGRKFIRQGKVVKVERTNFQICRKSQQDRILFLFSDILIYGSLNSYGYNFHRKIPLDSCKVIDMPDREHALNPEPNRPSP